MSHITDKSLMSAIEKIDGLSDDALEKLSETHVKEQVTLVGYILSSAIEYESDSLLDHLMYYFNVFYEAISIQGVQLKTIDDAAIEDFQDEYFQTLDAFMETDDEDLILSLCNQPMLLSFFVNDIFGTDEEDATLPEDLANELFIVGVALITLLNRAIIE